MSFVTYLPIFHLFILELGKEIVCLIYDLNFVPDPDDIFCFCFPFACDVGKLEVTTVPGKNINSVWIFDKGADVDEPRSFAGGSFLGKNRKTVSVLYDFSEFLLESVYETFALCVKLRSILDVGAMITNTFTNERIHGKIIHNFSAHIFNGDVSVVAFSVDIEVPSFKNISDITDSFQEDTCRWLAYPALVLEITVYSAYIDVCFFIDKFAQKVIRNYGFVFEYKHRISSFCWKFFSHLSEFICGDFGKFHCSFVECLADESVFTKHLIHVNFSFLWSL